MKIQPPEKRDFRRSAGNADSRAALPFRAALVALALLFASDIPSAYAGNAGSFLRAYPLPVPTKQYQITENTSPLPVAEGYSLAFTATPGEFEPATFVLRSGETLSGATIQVSSLNGPATIPAANVDVRLLKTWYQASTGNCSCDIGHFLIPELLVKDDALVHVDQARQSNSLRATINGAQQYVDISTVGAMLPAGAVVQDAAGLQPFSMPLNTNKQVWLNVEVPPGTPAGTYNGTITVSVPGKPDTTLSLTANILPFALSASLIEQSIFYRPALQDSCSLLNSECKTQAQMHAEFVDMFDHGIRYPTTYDSVYSSLLPTRLAMAEAIGFGKDKIYNFGNSFEWVGSYDQNGIAVTVAQWNSFASAHGWGQVYTMAIDEATGATLDSESTSFQTVHNNGGKVIAAIPDVADALRPVVAQVDQVILYGYFATPADVSAVRSSLPPGGKVVMYGGPFTDMENPMYVRKHYGFALLYKGYDGAMNYAYQDARHGDAWNDFTGDSQGARRLAWTYPTSNGVVDTIQWEGYREAVDDIRYASTLAAVKGWSKAQLVSYLQGLATLAANPDASNFDADATRQTIIRDILAASPSGGSVAPPSGSCTYGISPGSASVNATGAAGSLSVTAGAGCAWTSSPNASWIGLTAGGSGSGSGTVAYSVAANTGAARSGTLTVAGVTFTVSQTGSCTYSLSATSASATASGGTGSLNVTVPTGCAWSSSSNVAWVTVISGATGSGNGTITYSVAANTGAARSGTITIAGQTLTINQAGVATACGYSLSSTSTNMPAGGGSRSVTVGTTTGCTWSASSNVAWITVTNGSSGTGNGSVNYVVAQNSGPARTGTVTIANQTYSISQRRGK